MKKDVFLVFLCSLFITISIQAQNNNLKEYTYFLDLVKSTSFKLKNERLMSIEQNWEERFEIYAVETLYLIKEARVATRLLKILHQKTGKRFAYDFNAWYEYIWNKEPVYNDHYYTFKAALHAIIDKKFKTYFLNRENINDIRLDEVRWGGVVQDGIPPLHSPKMIAATNAHYLKDSNIVFGVFVNGEARAYPKRILAWHEMFTDIIGDIPVAGVYCTLCGTVILYKTEHKGILYNMGTSGFLYRSNKLMYDQKTQSLWSTLLGKPVLGPLVGKGIELKYLSSVTTTWGEWKKLHPETTVLSLDTGYRRDYGEGVAYKDYFATDNVMFNVPKQDNRLKNKEEILAIRLSDETDENLAISSKFLQRNPIYKNSINKKPFTVFTDKSGSHRVYFTQKIEFVSYDKSTQATDAHGHTWTLFEEHMENIFTKERLERLPSYNAFWFGYQAAFPKVSLIK